MIHPTHMDNTGFFALITFGGLIALFANYVVRPWGAKIEELERKKHASKDLFAEKSPSPTINLEERKEHVFKLKDKN